MDRGEYPVEVEIHHSPYSRSTVRTIILGQGSSWPLIAAFGKGEAIRSERPSHVYYESD